jgi:hypothetical protein
MFLCDIMADDVAALRWLVQQQLGFSAETDAKR